MADLKDDLRELGRQAGPGVDPDLVAARVVAALPAAPLPRRERARRWVAAAVLAILVALAATPPVRATVADWFGFGDVRVEPGEAPSVSPSGSPEVPAVPEGTRLEAAAAAATFPVLVPRLLGAPDGVEVSADGRRVSMSWGSGPDVVRLDQLAGGVDYAAIKRARRLQFLSVGGRDALWFPEPHRVGLLDAAGDRAGAFRAAARTLVVPHGTSTLRLEGVSSLSRARAVAASLAPVG